MASAARFPAPMAAITVAGPNTTSPPAKTPGTEVSKVSLFTSIVPQRLKATSGSPASALSRSASGRCPTAATTMSKDRSCSDPGTGTGRRRPEASGSPSSMRTQRSPDMTPFLPRTSIGAVRYSKRTPSLSVSRISCSTAGISARVRR